MRVILLEKVENLGQMGDEVTVKPGYARNFLLPQKKVLRATEENRGYFQKQKAQLEAENLKKKSDAEKVAKKIEGTSVIVLRQAGEAGQLYGSVSARDISEGVTEAGCTINRTQVVIDQPIKIIGIYPIRVVLHPEVTTQITVNVARSQEEAETQAAAVKAGRALGAMPPQTEDTEDEKPRRGKKAAAVEAEASSEETADAAPEAAADEKPAKKTRAKKAKATDEDAA